MSEPIYTLEDLRDWEQSGTWLAVLGHPIRHSLSPAMHHAALQEMALTEPSLGNWNYARFDIRVEDLGEALGLLHQNHFLGLNLTIPHKVEAFQYVQRCEPLAERMRAMNTLMWTPEGYRGYNTDGYGLEAAIQRNLGLELADKEVVLLGAGGAARAAAVQILERGCRSLWIGNRSQGRLEAVVDSLTAHYTDAQIRGFLFSALPVTLPGDALIIQATASGLKETDAAPMELGVFGPDSALFDMVYNPPETVTMRAARAQGMAVANGLDMLVFQGARALELWTGKKVPSDCMRSAVEKRLKGTCL